MSPELREHLENELGKLIASRDRVKHQLEYEATAHQQAAREYTAQIAQREAVIAGLKELLASDMSPEEKANLEAAWRARFP